MIVKRNDWGLLAAIVIFALSVFFTTLTCGQPLSIQKWSGIIAILALLYMTARTKKKDRDSPEEPE